MPSTSAPIAPTYVSIATAADILACSTKTIRRKIASGELPARRIGTRLIRIDAADLAELGRPLTTARRA